MRGRRRSRPPSARRATVEHRDGPFRVSIGRSRPKRPSLVIATGGPSIPKIGATGFAYDLARRFGLKIVEPRPALVPLTLAGDEALFRTLSGVAAEVVAARARARFREAALFTHRGLSGPAILQVSSYWRHGERGRDRFPARPVQPAGSGRPSATSPASRFARLLGARCPTGWPRRLPTGSGWTASSANMPDRALDDAERRLADWHFTPNGSEGFAKAEVTVGGISTAELSSQTMEAKRVPGLYAIGEAVDVTGWLGGYNFQWAWASGYAAAQAL